MYLGLRASDAAPLCCVGAMPTPAMAIWRSVSNAAACTSRRLLSLALAISHPNRWP